MDQAVSLLAEPGKALRIDFFPLRTEVIRLPKEITFVVCNSLIRAPKSDTVRYAYNRRVIECRLARALLSNVVTRKTGKINAAIRLADLSAKNLGMDPGVLNKMAVEGIGELPLSLRDIAHRLGETVEKVERENCTLRDGTLLKEPSEGFRVWNRYHHVVTEADRVNLAVTALQDGNVAEIGRLMNDSHTSCRDDYEISCPELEALVSIARDHGALGARLTGAGFGGCTVNAVSSESVEQFIRGVTADYYQGYVKQEKGREFIGYHDLCDVIFPCRATTGAGAWPVEQLIG
jgi:N-acetylgalactosamine kinase